MKTTLSVEKFICFPQFFRVYLEIKALQVNLENLAML